MIALLELFAFGTFWFWALIASALVLMIIAADSASGKGATMTLVGTVFLLYFLGNKEPIGDFLSYILSNPLVLILVAAGYFAAGTVWSVVKWYLYLINERDSHKARGRTVSEAPKVSDHTGDIMVWMTYWPFSAVWTIINDPVKKTFTFILSKIGGNMQRMSDKIFEPIVKK